MSRILSTCIETLIAAVILIPVFLLMNAQYFHGKRRTAVYLIFALYLCAMYAVVGLPDITYHRFDPNINLIPGQYMFSDWENTLLNVILFLPFGAALPLLWADFRPLWKTVLWGFGLSLFIEILQLFTYRATDVNDLITNTLGTALGFAAARLILKLVPSLHPQEDASDRTLLFSLVFGVMFLIQPFLARLVWNIIHM